MANPDAIKARTNLIKMEQLSGKIRNHVGVFVTEPEMEENLKKIDHIITHLRSWGICSLGMTGEDSKKLDDDLIADLKRILNLNS